MHPAAQTQRQTAAKSKTRSRDGAKAAASPGLAALQRAADGSQSTSRLATLRAQILAQTGRAATSQLFNDNAQSNPHMFGADCQTFADNVFTAAADGVTGNFGGFRAMGPESVDPTQARNTDTRPATAPERQGFVFEMRNMVQRDWHTRGRFPPNRWPTLAAKQVALFRELNARTEVAAVQDTQARRVGWGQPGGGIGQRTR